MSGATSTILLTGASGVVGRAVAAELRAHTVGLAHSDADVPEVDELLLGDLSQPRMGLDRARWQALPNEIDAIVHSGALTEWGQPAARYTEINVEGTRRAIELAQAANAPIHLISTIFVLALTKAAGPVPAENVVRNYISSKLACERLVQASGVPHTIFRPTNLVGDSRTGASSKPQIVQALADFICRGQAPYFPSHPGNLIDVAPLDALSLPVARAAEGELTEGTYYVSYGHEAMTVQTALNVLEEHAQAIGREIARADIVDPRETPPVPLEQVRGSLRPFVRVGIDVSEVTHASGGVLPSSLPELRERFGVPLVSPVDAFRRSLVYWAERRGKLQASVEAR
jgi:nucleoside-diphosphate-sugar epimerase